jgi:threonine/homoserine/homoserine lactone efflux protein
MIVRVAPVWSFLAVTVPLVLAPGASTAVVLRNSLAGGTRAGVVTAVGVNTGSLCYGLLTAFGFALVVRHWPATWLVLRLAGMLYLAWLGVRALLRAVDRQRTVIAARGDHEQGAWRSVSEGFMTNALNPAIATFYLVLLPQFIPVGAPIARTALLLTALHIALAFSWHVVWAAAGGTLVRTLASPGVRRTLEAITAVALLGFAGKLLTGVIGAGLQAGLGIGSLGIGSAGLQAGLTIAVIARPAAARSRASSPPSPRARRGTPRESRQGRIPGPAPRSARSRSRSRRR